ncbi:MAG: ATP synthase F1 subunit gamma [Verrucomicrobia bacterium 21-51-4]|nr:MAG: ATP synthase F1 subunit gamma [Verrucomicrobia bacterium 21-51-4]HQU08501.1 ATP synthase F1 subunit gamma [Opitutales bacterium]
MKGIREIKHRIKAVKNTAQITRAMQLVAASKMKRAQEAAIAKRPYALLLAEILGSLVSRVESAPSPLMEKRSVKTRGILVMGTDKGLCGGLNTNLFRSLHDLDGDIKFVTIGKRASQFVSRTGRDLVADFTVSDHVSFSEVRLAAEYMIQAYLKGTIDTVEVLFTRFINTLRQEPCLEPLLPLQDMDHTLQALRARLGVTEVVDDSRDMLFEPSVDALLEQLPALFVKEEIYEMMLEAKASEHSARMVAMKSATDNANNLVADLTLEYNKARQAGITQEILEIAAATANQSAA